jgi:hypothetical protein
MILKRWIVFKTESASSKGWNERKLQPAGHLTRMLAELPKIGVLQEGKF